MGSLVFFVAEGGMVKGERSYISEQVRWTSHFYLSVIYLLFWNPSWGAEEGGRGKRLTILLFPNSKAMGASTVICSSKYLLAQVWSKTEWSYLSQMGLHTCKSIPQGGPWATRGRDSPFLCVSDGNTQERLVFASGHSWPSVWNEFAGIEAHLRKIRPFNLEYNNYITTHAWLLCFDETIDLEFPSPFCLRNHTCSYL